MPQFWEPPSSICSRGCPCHSRMSTHRVDSMNIRSIPVGSCSSLSSLDQRVNSNLKTSLIDSARVNAKEWQ